MKFRLAVLAAVALACAPKHPVLTVPYDKRFHEIAPDSFDVEFVTTKGRMLVRAHREWSPKGVDRFYAFANNRYFDSVAFYRTVPGFVAQFGYSGDTAVNRAWLDEIIIDEPVKASNTRGMLSFARAGPNTRGTQFFFNIVDNVRLDALNGIGFPPIAHIVDGASVLDSLNGEYGNDPDQERITKEGNAYLRREFPRLDYIVRARVVKIYKR